MAVSIALILASACGGGDGNAGNADSGDEVPSGSADGSRVDADGSSATAEWLFEGDADEGDSADLGESETGAPPEAEEGEPASVPAADREELDVAGLPFDLSSLAPCTLVTGEEFSAWTGDTQAADPVPLEDGEACGFIAADDMRRMAIGVLVQPDGAPHFVPEEAGDEISADVGPGVNRVRWAPAHPVRRSSTLSVELDGFDIVVEMSARDSSSDADLRDAALNFARLALERLT